MSKWNFEEKLALATAMAMDKRLTPDYVVSQYHIAAENSMGSA